METGLMLVATFVLVVLGYIFWEVIKTIKGE